VGDAAFYQNSLTSLIDMCGGVQVTAEDDADEMLFCSASCHKQFTDARQQNTAGDLDASSKLADSAVNGAVSSPQLSQASASSSPPHPAIKLSICLDPQQGAIAILPGTQTSRSAEKSLKHKVDSNLDKVCVDRIELVLYTGHY